MESESWMFRECPSLEIMEFWFQNVLWDHGDGPGPRAQGSVFMFTRTLSSC